MSAGPASVVLVSSGLDSAVLLVHEALAGAVRPVYVRAGLAWEPAELRMLSRLLAVPAIAARTRPLVVVDLPLDDVYPADHWALTGHPPAYRSPDAEVFLPGRNVGLLAKAALVAAHERAPRIVMGTLAGNPFPDATPRFFAAMSDALSIGLACTVAVATPLATLRKPQVVELGARLGVPFALTLSCMNPVGDAHCGACSKCRERREAFIEAGVLDPSTYGREAP